ncbi:hypothetical protein BDN72DRAFT_846487 [Pluteus cervinus]|uniref:Uncharacterized protein n=1 Tax=Pluteus cervinus TaxID=181527 RepID=A0ACD3AH01_9AGAR|nr:hypothetical protein BDN72DRAFT_846487 [Pluteus cervinus]
MFGESESESPRVPSPWDNLISNSPSPVPSTRSSPRLTAELIPRLVPEADDGNVEYKLQLLSPSPARFARLVTQLKWRLLEGGGQAYYELGVADSGALIGLPRAELEQSLETLEMMAGEIGASVIVVKEIEVPATLAGLAVSQTEKWNRKQIGGPVSGEETSGGDSTTTNHSTTETEAETSATDVDLDDEAVDLSRTVVLGYSNGNAVVLKGSVDGSAHGVFSMDPEPDPADNADAEADADVPQFSIDLEISSVYKPRPMRTRMYGLTHAALLHGKHKRGKKKHKHLPPLTSTSSSEGVSQEGGGNASHDKSVNRRQARDRRREEKRKAKSLQAAIANTTAKNGQAALEPELGEEAEETGVDALASGLETFHVSVEDPVEDLVPQNNDIPTLELPEDEEANDGDDDVFPPPTTPAPYAPFQPATNSSTSYLSVTSMPKATTPDDEGVVPPINGEPRLIVEALVVRKLSIEEAFLDFGGFSLI